MAGKFLACLVAVASMSAPVGIAQSGPGQPGPLSWVFVNWAEPTKAPAEVLTGNRIEMPSFSMDADAVTVQRGGLVHTRQLLGLDIGKGNFGFGDLIGQLQGICRAHEATLKDVAKLNLYASSSDGALMAAIEDGLLIPVLKETDKLSLQDVVFEAKAAIERARAGRPNSTDLTGGTFSISNMGMFDVENFTAIINPGQGAVLAVSSIRDEPIVSDGQITIGQMMKVTISVDHRVIDGVMAGNFLKAFKEALENPALLMAPIS